MLRPTRNPSPDQRSAVEAKPAESDIATRKPLITIDIDALAAAIAERLPSSEGQRWFTLAEAAEYMRVSESWLRERLGEIPHVRPGSKLLFNRQELDQWLTGHRRR